MSFYTSCFLTMPRTVQERELVDDITLTSLDGVLNCIQGRPLHTAISKVARSSSSRLNGLLGHTGMILLFKLQKIIMS